MEKAKKYWVWIVIGVLFLGIQAFQWLVVGGRIGVAQEEHQQVINAINAFKGVVMNLETQYPTQGDLNTSDEQFALLRKEAEAVTARWRKYTDGLNRWMQGTQILNPTTGTPERWETFNEFLRNQYLQLFERAEKALAEKMRPRIEVMLADSCYASDRTILHRDEALAKAKEVAPSLAMYYAHIFKPEALIPRIRHGKTEIRLEDMAFVESERGKGSPTGWRAWREFLLIRDILERVVPAIEVEVERWLAELPPEARKKEEGVPGTLGIETKRIALKPVKRQGWRFVEQISEISFAPPELGTHVLPVPRKESKEGESTAPVPPAAGQEAPRYHDKHTMTIKLIGHIKVIDAFMREILKAEDIFYAPVSAEVERFPDNETMGPPPPQQPPEEEASDFGSASYLMKPPRDFQRIASFDHEPPVKATLTYDVYRFRYADTPNETREEIKE